jgi:hypothetical protein
VLLADHRTYRAERSGVLGRRSGPPPRDRDQHDHHAPSGGRRVQHAQAFRAIAEWAFGPRLPGSSPPLSTRIGCSGRPWRLRPSPATLLVPLDGSTNATAALSVARGLAHLKGATVVLIYVGTELLAPDELLGRMRLSAEDVGGLAIDQCTGSPADTIVRQAAARDSMLVVMCGEQAAE